MTAGQGFGFTQFKDGATHDINSTINEDVWVDYQAPGMQTTVNLLNGGSIAPPYKLQGFNDSRINMSIGSFSHYLYANGNSQITMGGTVYQYLYANDNSQITMSGGSVDILYAYNSSRVNMSGGSVGEEFIAYGSSQVTMSGGSVGLDVPFGGADLSARDSSRVNMSGGLVRGSLCGLGSSQVTMSGGSVSGYLHAYGSSQVTMSGGSVSGYLYAQDSSRVTMSGGTIRNENLILLEATAILALDGTNFAIDGTPFNFGEITSILGGAYSNEPYRRLTGTLANGDILNNPFQIGNTAKIVLIPAPTIPPVADAGSDQTVIDIDNNGSEQVTLDGSGSSDSDGTIVSWVWTDNLGDTIPNGEITTATLSVGIHTITLTVADNDGLTDTNTVTVIVEPYPNQPPVADADGPYTIYVGDTLTLNASSSTDEHNNIVSYLWDLDDNNSFETNAGSNAVFDVNYTSLQSLGLLIGNTYKIHLKVTDGGGLSNVASTTLTIIPTPALQVIVDIKPGSCPNPLNVKSSGVLPVAILGTADFDVTTIDATSIRLVGVSPLRSSIEDVAGPVADSNDCNCTEDGPDGFPDLTLKFKTQDIVEAIGDVNYGDILTLKLTGVTIGEIPIEGTDCVLISGKNKPFNKFDINKDGVVD